MSGASYNGDYYRTFPSRCGCKVWAYCASGDPVEDERRRSNVPPLIHDHKCLLLHPHNQAPAVQAWLKGETP